MNSSSLAQKDLLHGKSLLRVRGLYSLEQTILQKQNELAQLVLNASSFYNECQELPFVLSIAYIRQTIAYKNAPKFDRAKFHIPAIGFVQWVCGERKDISKWEDVSRHLESANVSLDERLLHMQAFCAFKEIYYHGRQLAEDLKCLYRLQSEIRSMIRHEQMEAGIPSCLR